jgi:D-tyrosyl-tRNA(Tyr) deacylase
VIALVQRVSQASVTVAGRETGRIGHGLLVLVCAEPTDTEEHARKLRRQAA